jgi:hypothetical protein
MAQNVDTEQNRAGIPLNQALTLNWKPGDKKLDYWDKKQWHHKVKHYK